VIGNTTETRAVLDLTVLIMANNEELNIGNALASVIGRVRDVIVVDSGSTDNTIEIAEGFGAQVYRHAAPCLSAQFDWILSECEIATPWVFRLDADEIASPELFTFLSGTLDGASSDVNGIAVQRRIVFMDRWMRFGGLCPNWEIRLWRRGYAAYERRSVDEHLVLASGRVVYASGHITDWNRKPLSAWLSKHIIYADREAREFSLGTFHVAEDSSSLPFETRFRRWCKCSLYYRTPAFSRSVLFFVYRYVFRCGFLDGTEGLVFHVLQCFWYRFLVDVFIRIQSRTSMTSNSK